MLGPNSPPHARCLINRNCRASARADDTTPLLQQDSRSCKTTKMPGREYPCAACGETRRSRALLRLCNTKTTCATSTKSKIKQSIKKGINNFLTEGFGGYQYFKTGAAHQEMLRQIYGPTEQRVAGLGQMYAFQLRLRLFAWRREVEQFAIDEELYAEWNNLFGAEVEDGEEGEGEEVEEVEAYEWETRAVVDGDGLYDLHRC